MGNGKKVIRKDYGVRIKYMSFLPKLTLIDYDYPVIIYRNAEAVDLANELVAAEYVRELLREAKFLLSGRKVVFILWQNDGIRMADAWVFGKNESETAGAEISVYLFEGTKRYESPTVTAADGLKILAEEARQL